MSETAATVSSDVDLSRILPAMREAQRAWAAQPLEARVSHLRAVAQRVAAESEQLAALVCEETRKDAADAWFADVLGLGEIFDWWTGPGLAALKPEKAPISSVKMPGKEGVLRYEPKGVIGLITPWNFPLAIPVRTLVPALVTGNAVLFKPSEVTPKTGDAIARIFNSILPSGLLQVVHGRKEAGEAVVDAADHVVFTGSVATGKAIAARCAPLLKSVGLELGGKDAAIVLADCDFDRTVQGVYWGAMGNSGQNCASVERVYVEERLHDRFVGALAAMARSNPVAPVATEAQDAIVRKHLADAEARGAALHGQYPGPVILTDVPDDALILTEETFGPVCPVVRVPDGDAALRKANASEFGLTTSIWTANEPRAKRLAALASTGVVTINNVGFTAALPFAPWSGRRHTGHGVTGSHLAVLELVQPKFVLIDRATPVEAWWFPYDQGAVSFARRTARWFAAKGLAKLAQTPALLGAQRARAKAQKQAFPRA